MSWNILVLYYKYIIIVIKIVLPLVRILIYDGLFSRSFFNAKFEYNINSNNTNYFSIYLVSTYVYFTTQNGPKRQNNKSQFIFSKVECWVLKNHNCFVLYLNCNLLFSRNFFFKNATYF